MQTQPAISPLTEPGTGRLKLSAYAPRLIARESLCTSLSGISKCHLPAETGPNPPPHPPFRAHQTANSPPNSTQTRP